jgi:ubiquinone biosynthesis O-methyltransferase
VLSLEVVEHVASAQSFLRDLGTLVLPGGCALVSTINRTLLARLLAVHLAEQVLRWVPAGTHDPEMFVTPEEMRLGLEAGGLQWREALGMTLDVASGTWGPTADLGVNYLAFATKDVEKTLEKV